jgi:hypothetical protein
VTAEDVQTLRDALTLANGVGYRFDDVLAALDRLVAELQRLQDASDMREMNETEGNEILGEVVAQIEAVSPAPAEMPCVFQRLAVFLTAVRTRQAFSPAYRRFLAWCSPGPDSNRRKRLCRPAPSLSVTGTGSAV